MKNNYYIYGGSGHAKVVVDLILSTKIALETIFDDNPKFINLLGIPIVHSQEIQKKDNSKFIIAIGDNAIRKKIVVNNSFQFFTAIHPSATVSKFAFLGLGSVVMPQTVINAEARVGMHCIINSGSVIEHDCVLEDYVHISPNASLAGNVTVGEGTQIGIGASIIQGIRIGKWAKIGAGSVVIRDIPDYAVAVGNPSRIIKYNSNEE